VVVYDNKSFMTFHNCFSNGHKIYQLIFLHVDRESINYYFRLWETSCV